MRNSLSQIMAICVLLGFSACQKIEDTAESTDQDLFSVIEDGEDGYAAASYSATDTSSAEPTRRRRHLRKHFWGYALKLKKLDPTISSVVGVSLRNPIRDDLDETLPPECQIAVEIVSNLKLKVQKEPRWVEEAAVQATVSEDGHTITVNREANGMRMVFSTHPADAEVKSATLTLSGSITCDGESADVEKELSSYINSDSRRFRFFDQFADVLLRGLGVNFPAETATPIEE